MKSITFRFVCAAWVVAWTMALSEAQAQTALPTNDTKSTSLARSLPPLPPGVIDLKFSDFFVHPTGPRGLEFTKKLRGLDGKRVRILGYMVRQEAPPNGNFLLSPVPVTLHEHDDECFIDDLPTSVVRVISPAHAGKPVPPTPDLLLLTGKLSIGYNSEPDGHPSWVRLNLDHSK